MTYPSDLNDEQWELIKDHFNTGNYGKSRKYTQRLLVNGVFYLIKTGCQWRFLPKEYPPWKTVYSFYKRAKDRGWWEKMMRDLVQKSRIKMRRKPDPSYSLIDFQSVKTTDNAHERGIDGAKRWAQKTEAAMQEGRYFKTTAAAKKRTLGDLIDRYIKEILPRKPKNAHNTEAQLKWWKQEIGHCILLDVTPAIIGEHRDKLLEGKTPKGNIRSPTTVVRYLSALSHAFTIAVK